MADIKTLTQRIIRDTNRRHGATDVQHSLMVDLDNINKHANEIMTLIETWGGNQIEREKANELLPLVSGSASFDAVKRIWNAAENYTLHELGEICKGDGAYCEDVPDLETYFERHYR